MSVTPNRTGFAIALAWPETYCKQAGAWYEPVTRFLKFNQHYYYKAGHAALVLVDAINKSCHYFDFGRYHTPFQHGRVRSALTDDDLQMKTTPLISTKDRFYLDNFDEILTELQTNSACHGEGALHASYCPIDFEKAVEKAVSMQKASPLPYGPFAYKGTNCSRFVNTVIRAGNPDSKFAFRLNYLVPFTPTPMNNVNALEYKTVKARLLKGELFCPIGKLKKGDLKSTMKQPERNSIIPEHAQWLSGEGAGSWFTLDIDQGHLLVNRFSPEGILECKGYYENENLTENIMEMKPQVTYPSNCKSVVLIVQGERMVFSRASI